MNRTVKAVVTGACLVVGFYLTVLVIRAIWFLGLMLLPFLVIAFSVYVVGYGLPNFGEHGRKLHDRAERKARRALDWADFHAPVWTWPLIFAARTFLDWLGLRVGTNSKPQHR